MVAQPTFERRRRAPIGNILLVGSGDIARRAIPQLIGHARVYALCRSLSDAAELRALGALPIVGDLDTAASLRRLAGLASILLHCAPPPDCGEGDPRTARLLAALARGGRAPDRIVYISTSGVYGDCKGEIVPETRRLHPGSARARRRVDAEKRLRRFCRNHGSRLAILRAPGIYAAQRLPLARIARGDPVLARTDDVFTNHIHADDLAHLCVAAIYRGPHLRIYNACDGSQIRMGDYHDRVADIFGLRRPPRASRGEIERVSSPLTLSFLSESRRLDNHRILKELRTPLLFPEIGEGLRAIHATTITKRTDP